MLVRKLLAEEDLPVRSVVMMAPPNQGARLADWLFQKRVVRWASGPTAHRLRSGSDGAVNALPVPKCPLMVVAGSRGRGPGYFPLFRFMEEDNDGVVSVRTTRLPGMEKHLVVRSSHTWIMNKKQVIEEVASFLQKH